MAVAPAKRNGHKKHENAQKEEQDPGQPAKVLVGFSCVFVVFVASTVFGSL
jgi:hypothetical protein